MVSTNCLINKWLDEKTGGEHYPGRGLAPKVAPTQDPILSSKNILDSSITDIIYRLDHQKLLEKLHGKLKNRGDGCP